MKYDINKILDLLPHRYPFLLVDRIEDLVLTDDLIEVTGIKNVSINEPFFQGHFPDEPVMPGVLVIEAMGQVAAVLLKVCTEVKEGERRLVYVTSIDKVKFRRPVKPGDQLRLWRLCSSAEATTSSSIQGNNRWGSCGRRNYGLRGILRAYT